MYVMNLWRYPVKSMGGQELQQASLGPLGIEGDRLLHVEDSRGRVITSRSHPRLLGHHGAIASDGRLTVDGRLWDSPEVGVDVVAIAGPGASLVWDETAERFDVLPLLIATDGAIAEFGHDYRRLRPNIVIGDVKGMTEGSWAGGCLRIGETRIGVQDLRLRCIMTSFDPDTQVQDKGITRDIYSRFDGKLALNCFVITGGEIAVGDPVEYVSAAGCAQKQSGVFT